MARIMFSDLPAWKRDFYRALVDSFGGFVQGYDGGYLTTVLPADPVAAGCLMAAMRALGMPCAENGRWDFPRETGGCPGPWDKPNGNWGKAAFAVGKGA